MHELQARRRLCGNAETLEACEPPDPGLDPAVEADQKEQVEHVARAVASLSPALREIVVVRVYSGRDYASIARIIDMSAATLRGWLRYALEALRKALAPMCEV